MSHAYTKRRTFTPIFCLTQIVHFLLLSPACTLKNGSCETGGISLHSLRSTFPNNFPSFFLSLSPTITRGLSNHFPSIFPGFSQCSKPEVFGLLPGSGREHRASAHCGGLATLPHVRPSRPGERGIFGEWWRSGTTLWHF